MADTRKPLLYLIYEDLTSAVKGISSKVTLGRPEPVGTEVASFISVELPTSIRQRIKGDFDMSVDTFGTFTIFCKSKSDHTLNIGSQSNLVQSVIDLFPIDGKYIVASNPRIIMQGFDETGYQVTTISFWLRTRFNARNTGINTQNS